MKAECSSLWLQQESTRRQNWIDIRVKKKPATVALTGDTALMAVGES
jgi:hypothetical protein